MAKVFDIDATQAISPIVSVLANCTGADGEKDLCYNQPNLTRTLSYAASSDAFSANLIGYVYMFARAVSYYIGTRIFQITPADTNELRALQPPAGKSSPIDTSQGVLTYMNDTHLETLNTTTELASASNKLAEAIERPRYPYPGQCGACLS
ncbi:hypothetical protein LTR09_012714 [Extremus antarcticus]|uniref:Uncharacterized protein n=1 Tax=Extremus antarcticus TaxID=702011 RepID=A0AAJ0D9E6_9PEZI|nr:hypothetical protein LTR09_012714 [Extremus antarcticus]